MVDPASSHLGLLPAPSPLQVVGFATEDLRDVLPGLPVDVLEHLVLVIPTKESVLPSVGMGRVEEPGRGRSGEAGREEEVRVVSWSSDSHNVA